MKRVLSFLMAFTLLITSFSHVAYADEATGEITEEVVANVEEGQTVNVNLRVGETVTYNLNPELDVNNLVKGENFDNIVAMNVNTGEVITYPRSRAKLAMGMVSNTANFNGKEVELEDCLFTFTPAGSDYYISHDNVYLSHNIAGASAGKPCSTTKATIAVEHINDENYTGFRLKSANSYLFFHKRAHENGQLIFDKQNGSDDDRVYFDLFTPAVDASAGSEIQGYKKIEGLDELVEITQCLIVSKADNGNYYILNPVATGEKCNYVAQIVSGHIVSAVQIGSGQKKVSECLFTFNSTGEENKYRISAVTTEGTVYLNHKSASSHIPTTSNSNTIIEVLKGSGNQSEQFSFRDTSSGNAGQYLQFYRGGNNGVYQFDRQNGTDTNTYYELYELSKSTPDDSAIVGFKKVTSIKDGGKYLITVPATDGAYYFVNPSTSTTALDHVAKLKTDTTLEDENVTIIDDTLITFTAVAPGATSVTVSGVTYNINVAYTEDTITLRKGESFAVSGPLQSEPNDESIISTELINNAVAPYTKVDAIADGYYLIGNANYIIKNSVTSENPSGLVMESANYAAGDYARYIWKVTAVDGGYTIQDINGKYINFGAVVQSKTSERSVILSTKPQVLTIVQQDDGTLRISYENYKLNNYGSGTRRAAAWNGEDSGNAWNFYAGSADAVKVTSVGTGTATFAANGFNYTVNCNPVDYTALNNAIDSAVALVKTDYFTKEWRVFETVLTEAKALVSENSEATQPQVDAKQVELADAIASLRHLPVYTAPNVNDLAPGAPTGTTENQPFTDEISTNFRIPAMITLSDGTIIAAADSRWDHSGDGCSIDIILSKSTDNGATWEYSFPAFFNDTTNAKDNYGACFIDPVLVRDAKDKIYMMVDLYPGGIDLNTAPKRPDAASGFVEINGVKRLVLYTSNNPDVQNDTNYDYYVGDYTTVDEKKLAPVYEVFGENEYNDIASYYIDPYFNLYNAEREELYCVQRGDATKKVQQNVFFYDSLLHVRCATYLYLITSEDKGETWSEPMLLNSQIRKAENPDVFYGVGPGAGLWFDNGTEDGIVMLPAYNNNNNSSTERASFIYSADGGMTWKRSQDATPDQSSESCLIQLDDKTVRHFYRSYNNNKIEYTDHTLENGEWQAGSPVTVDVVRKDNNQVSAIRYSKTINGKPVIVFSTATSGSSNYVRRNGKIYLFTVDMEADGMPMELVATYDNDPSSDADVYAYSSIAELKDGSIGLLYENDDTQNACKITYKRISMDELAPGVLFDIPASPDGVKSEVAGYNLVLEGNIGLKFHMRLGEDVTTDAGAKMIFTLEREDSVETIEISVTEELATTIDDVKYYVFKCPVPVKDMDTEITGQIVLSNGKKGIEFTYKVKDYIDYMLENDEKYADEVELVTAMSDFGNYAAAYFAGETKADAPEITEEELVNLAYYAGTLPADNRYVGSSLLLKSDTILRHYFTEKVTEDAVAKGNFYYIYSEGIPAHELGEAIETSVGGMTITYNPLSYAYIALTREGVDENLRDLMYSMYLYYQAARAYLN